MTISFISPVSWLTGLFLLIISFNTLGACYITSTTNAVLPPQAPIEVSPATAIGREISTIAADFSSLGVIGHCDGFGSNTISYDMGASFSKQSSLANVFNTAVPGIGMKIIVDGLGYAGTGTAHAMPARDFNFYPITITFVKTGDTPAEFNGNVFFGSGVPIVEVHANGSGSVAITGETGLVVTACDITTPYTMNIDMGIIYHTEFGGPGQTSSAKPFSIGIQCSGTAAVKATITATADANASMPNSAIKIVEQEDGSTGLALQLLDESNNVLMLNTPMDLATVSGGHTFNWSARFIQVLNAVTTGPVNATATITFSYQ